jgi:hypothetical protein
MKRRYEGGSWLLASFGLAMLVCSMLLMPQGQALAQGYFGYCPRPDCETPACNTPPCSEIFDYSCNCISSA